MKTDFREDGMARIDQIPLDELSAEQKRIHDKILEQRSRKTIGGPLGALLHAPEICEPVADFVDHFLSDTRVPHKLKELAILIVARHYTAQYEWFVHEPRARDAGLSDDAIEAIRARRNPDFKDPAEAAVYDMASEIVEHRQLSDAHYAAVVAALGEPAVAELITQIGFYHAISIVLVSYRIEVPDGAANPLSD